MHLVLFLPAIIVLFVVHALYLNCVAEDAFISFRFAKNFANGAGLVWNKGEPPVEGYTNFLWVMLSALFLELNLNPVFWTQVIGVLASIGTILYTYRFSTALLNFQNNYSLIPCLFLVASGPFATWSASGMETNFFGFFLLVGCYSFAHAWKRNGWKERFVGYLALLLATFTRPEGLMIFSVIFLMDLFLSTGNNRRYFKRLLIPILLYCLPILIYMVWRFGYFGYLLPNTFYAKTGGGLYQYLRGGRYTLYFALFYVLPLLSLLIITPIKIVHPIIRPVTIRDLRNHIENHVGVYCSVLVCFTFLAYIIYVGGDYMAMYRFFVPVLPFVYLLFGVYVNKVFPAHFAFSPKSRLRSGLLMFALFATAFQSTPLEKKLFRKPRFHHGHFRGVQLERWHSNRLSLIGRFFNDYRRDENEALATDAIGATSYYSNMKVYDMYGLVDTYIAHQKRTNRELGSGLPGHEKGDLSYILSKRPTYIMFNRKLTKKPLLIKNPGRFRNYKHTSFWLVDETNKEAGFFTFLEIKNGME